MEISPFFQQGLDPGQLEREKALVLKSIDSVQEAIKEIDFRLIKEILTDFCKKLGGVSDEDRAFFLKHILEMEYDIHVVYSEELDSNLQGGLYGEKHQSKGTVTIMSVWNNVITIFARECVDGNGELHYEDRLLLMRGMIHEILHAQTELSVKDDVTGESQEHIGIAYLNESNEGDSMDQNGLPFMLLNEGLTELITDAVFSEYLARSGTVKGYEVIRKWYHKELLIDRGVTYINERMAIMALVSKISEYSGVPEDKVYQSLLSEYFTLGDLSRSELLDECKDAPEIKELLLQVKQNNSDIFSHYDNADIDPILDLWDKSCLAHVKAMVSRDYIGEVNKRRVLRKKWYKVVQ